MKRRVCWLLMTAHKVDIIDTGIKLQYLFSHRHRLYVQQ